MSDAEKTLRILIEEIAADNKYDKYEVKIKPITTDGANFTTVLFVVTISIPGEENIELFGKVANVGEAFRSKLSAERIFTTERWAYTEMLNKFERIQNAHKVPKNNRLLAPKYYGSSEELYKETLVLENLIAKGFTIYDRLVSVDWEYASKAVQELAKLHALSIAWVEEDPEEFQTLLKDLKCGMMGMNLDTPNEEMLRGWEAIVNNAVNLVDESNRDRVEKFSQNLTQQYFNEFCKPLRRIVFAHGDFKSSNLMHRKNEDGDLQIVIIDYQTLQASNPFMDLLHFIFTCTDEQFRTHHFDALVHHYYEELRLALQRLDQDPDRIYSRDDFYSDLKEMLPFGLCIRLFTLQIITIDAAEAPSLDEDLPSIPFTPSAMYAERLNGIVNDCVRWGVI